jgi:putative transcriptional regulator
VLFLCLTPYRKVLYAVNITQGHLRYVTDINLFMGKIPMSRVAELRKKLDLTQRQLAEAVGVTETTIRNWENNRSGIEWFERVAKLCKALNCNPKELFGYVEAGEDILRQKIQEGKPEG